ncbi:hypothetical protein Sme01_69130 [Sphaerisporangium melleum]|uniref:Lipoprotein n=1 Tax=Sphaerisporangium melleum TaxID=321316 RepID=A0A917VS90_9ACTN|nr:hypothetical protein [Sphaerisporangium melleum]GGL12664.1 hypothetical protein GCM10007964_63400 [Sphaerisporangium melleum]GII74437.1 hypothetical protein Sme01_69130 [Sphaerisporangium melleum]
MTTKRQRTAAGKNAARRVVPACVQAGLAMLAVAACAHLRAADAVQAAAPRLVEPGDGGRQSFALRLTRQGTPYLFGGFAVCLDRAGAVEVTRVDFENPIGGLSVQEFALRPFYRGFGEDGVGWGEPRSLRRRGVSTALRTVTQVCAPDGSPRVEFSEVVLQTSRPAAVSASSSGFVITYSAGRAEGTVRVPFGITLCAPSDHSLPICGPRSPG